MDKVDHDMTRVELEIFVMLHTDMEVSEVLSMSDGLLSFLVTSVRYLREAA